MPKVLLDRSGIPSIAGQLEAAAMAQHVRVDQEREAVASPRYHSLIACDRPRRATLANEHVGRYRGFALQSAQGAAFPGADRMHASIPAFGPADVQPASRHLDVVPAQRNQLARPQAVWYAKSVSNLLARA